MTGIMQLHFIPAPPVYSEVVKNEYKDSDHVTYAVISTETDSHSPSPTPELPPRFGEEEKSRYIEGLIATSPGTFAPTPIKRATSTTSSIIKALQERAEAQQGTTNDSLYDSMEEDNNNGVTVHGGGYSEITDLDPRYFKGLKKHDDNGGVRLISVQGITAASINTDSISPIQQGLPLDMQMIHYVSAVGDRKALEGLLSLLPIIQGPVDMVLGSNKFKIREGINVRDGQGRTPLMHAVYNGHVGCVRMLAEAGANICIESSGE